MRQIPIITSVVIALALSARGTSVELPITPNQLDRQNYKFTVIANATNKEVAFHVTITAKTDEIPSDSEAHLSLVNHTLDSKGSIAGTEIKPFTPAVPIALQKDKRTWTADFTLSRETLKTPSLCFIFSELAHDTVNGKRITMPSVTFYEIKLKEFVKE